MRKLDSFLKARCSDAELSRLARLAEREGRPVGNLLRRIVAQHLDRVEATERAEA